LRRIIRALVGGLGALLMADWKKDELAKIAEADRSGSTHGR
jgi:hypothetical protein